MFFVKNFTSEKKSFVKKITSVNSYMSNRSYISKKKLLVKKITNKNAFTVKNFTNCSTNTKLF